MNAWYDWSDLPATAVAEFSINGWRTGKVHRTASGRKAAPRGRNRRQYRTACGNVVRAGFPVSAAPNSDLCGHCWGHILQAKAVS